MSKSHEESHTYIPDEMFFDDLFWKDGIGYARIFPYKDYYITSKGEVISLVKKIPKIIKQFPTNHGHMYVDLKNNKVRNRYLVHRLVAEAFVPNPLEYPIVRHLDDVPNNNDYKNLAWGTLLDNRKDMIRNDRDFKKAVYCHETGKTYRTCKMAAEDLGVSRSLITVCCKGKIHTVKGRHLCYADEINNKYKDPGWLMERTQYKPVTAISPKGEIMTFRSRKAASDYIGIPECGISSTISGHIPHSHGWRFKDGVDNDIADKCISDI